MKKPFNSFPGANGKYAIAIGYNPSSKSTPTVTDQTNNKLIDLFVKNHYVGYYLLKLYPEISSSPTIRKTAIYNKDFFLLIDDVINNYKEAVDYIVFWGRDFLVPNKISSTIIADLPSVGTQVTTDVRKATPLNPTTLHAHPSYVPSAMLGLKALPKLTGKHLR